MQAKFSKRLRISSQFLDDTRWKKFTETFVGFETWRFLCLIEKKNQKLTLTSCSNTIKSDMFLRSKNQFIEKNIKTTSRNSILSIGKTYNFERIHFWQICYWRSNSQYNSALVVVWRNLASTVELVHLQLQAGNFTSRPHVKRPDTLFTCATFSWQLTCETTSPSLSTQFWAPTSNIS